MAGRLSHGEVDRTWKADSTKTHPALASASFSRNDGDDQPAVRSNNWRTSVVILPVGAAISFMMVK